MKYLIEQTLPIQEITNALAFSPDGAQLALATRDKKASNLLYQLSDWSPRPAPRFVRRDLKFGADGTLVVAGVSVERFALTAPKLGKSPFSIPGHARGLTRVEVSPDGRWLAVHKYLEQLELWFLGVSPPEQRLSVPVSLHGSFFFSADSARLFYTAHGYRAGRPVDALHQVTLDPGGGSHPPSEGPMPEGLSVHDIVHATPHGLVAITFPDQDVVIYDWATLRPRRLGLRALEGQGLRSGFAVSSDGTHLVAQTFRDRDEGTRDWSLVVASLPTGEEVGTLPIGTVSAGLLALSARAERIAFTRCDTAREVQVFRRDDRYA
ncbi:MAG: WD40 repeat domain-containing protein [Deltaproteobacteria bacterium]|nr:WD40 repeat domain-containing protein [Deltaproteobacteria bacterium]